MKKLFYSIPLLSVVVLGSSFKGIETKSTDSSAVKESPFFAVIDGVAFDKKDNKYEARIKDGSTAEVILYGNDVKDNSGQYNPQTIGVEFAIYDGVVGLAPGSKVSFEFNKQKFFGNPSSTELLIKKAVLSADHKSMTISADFKSQVEKQQMSSDDYLSSLSINGSVENITIAVPASLQNSAASWK